MNTASLELCKELYQISGWDDLQFMWYWHETVEKKIHHREIGNYNKGEPIIPAYDLGYLLRKLPIASTVEKLNSSLYRAINEVLKISFDADTPEDAVCSLVISLFKEGILKK